MSQITCWGETDENTLEQCHVHGIIGSWQKLLWHWLIVRALEKCSCCWNHYKKPANCFSLVLLDPANQSLSTPWLDHTIPPLEDKAARCGRLTSTQHMVFPQRRTLWSGLRHAQDCPAWGFRMRTQGIYMYITSKVQWYIQRGDCIIVCYLLVSRKVWVQVRIYKVTHML